jgi:hypothetical protein
MPENPNIKEGQTPVNLDEIEPESAGAPENDNPEPPECDDSPTGQHEFDTSDEDEDMEVCVYCGAEKGQE